MTKFKHKYCENIFKSIRYRYFVILIDFLFLLSLPLLGRADIQFEEVTAHAGIHWVGQSYGVSWGDFDGDGWPDAWVNNHITFPSLYINNHDGTFTDKAAQVWPGKADDDTHGASWADFDDDGDQDLYQTIGAQQGKGFGDNQLLANQGGVFDNQANARGVENPLGRSRTALWFDFNGDGRLDIGVGNEKRPPEEVQAPSVLFQQAADGNFEDVSSSVGFNVPLSANYMQLSNLNLDGKPELIVHGVNYPQRIYDLGQQLLADISATLGLGKQTSDVWDSAIADFNGDLRPDIFLSRIKDLRGVVSDVFQANANKLMIRLLSDASERGVSFKSLGKVTFTFNSPVTNIFIGATGQHPATKKFTLSSTDPAVSGIFPHLPGSDNGFYIGFDPVSQSWTFLQSSSVNSEFYTVVETEGSTSNVTGIGFNPEAPALPPRLLLNTTSGFIDGTPSAGLNFPVWGMAVVAADFDNDMDVDIYMVCTRAASNLPNMLLDNLGDGHFQVVPAAGGAAGALLGSGENVAVADYDQDGFLDLYVTNGFYHFHRNLGPDQLFHNKGHGNHWLEMDLHGTQSNPQGIGARVYVTTPDGKTQLREQDNGIHRHAQNYQRLHFGLADNTIIQRLTVHWPSGIVQEYQDVPANQILSITEAKPIMTTGDITTDDRAGKVTFSVSLTEPAKVLTTINYATADVTALAGTNYVAKSGQLTFNPGEQTKTISVELIPRSTVGADITFKMKLYSQQNPTTAEALSIAKLTRYPIWFNDVTETSGLARYGQGTGASWGEFNGDECPDLWTPNHYERPSLYINQCNGSFLETNANVITWDQKKDDSHGAAWADFDNDGDQDLLETSGDYFNMLYVNDGKRFQDRATAYGVEGCPPTGHSCAALARTPLWLDWNQDGSTDLLIANTGTQPTRLYSGSGMRFENALSETGFQVTTPAQFAQLGDVDGDGLADILVHAGTYPNRIYSPATLPFTEMTSILPKNASVWDTVIGDFDGDLKNDLFLAKGVTTSDVYQPASNQVNVRAHMNKDEKGITFKATGNVTFDLEPFWTPTYFGSTSYRVPSTGYRSGLPDVTLSPDDSKNFGLKEHTPGISDGIYIGYDPVLKIWTIVRSGSSGWLGATITAEDAISEVNAIGITSFTANTTNTMLVNSTSGFTNNTNQAGLGIKANCYTAAAGDFDNDMDLDMYVPCGRPAGNTEHLLYANRGNGVFDLVPLSGGALASPIGSAESVAIADYDTDGFLDLFVVNSDSSLFFHGPHQLFHNASNNNHWLEIDLEGVVSNRDGIGAQLLLTTPDGKVQLREQNNGIHRLSQNHQRIHFGLGANTKVAKLEIRWPNGAVQTFQNTVADQLLRVIEPSTPALKGEPTYALGEDARVFVWKDSFDGPYHLRASGGGQNTQYSVKLLSDQLLAGATTVGGVSQWAQTEYSFNLNATVNNNEAGVDFKLQSGARAFLAVEKDGIANPRQLGIGATAKPLSPAGWIRSIDGLSTRPDYIPGVDVGLFIGAGAAANSLEARWTGGAVPAPGRSAAFDLFASLPLTSSAKPLFLETNDNLIQTENSFSVNGWVGINEDGADFSLAAGSEVGIAYQQESLFACRRVNHPKNNPENKDLGTPNAYWLPQAEPYGLPFYDAGKEMGFYLWKKNKTSGTWSVRATAGGNSRIYTGRLVLDQPALAVREVNLEKGSGGDVLDTIDPQHIRFRMVVTGTGLDGFDVAVKPGTNVQLELDDAAAVSLVRIGQQQWPIEHLPLLLGNW